MSPLLACRLIALDKHPGVRPIGIGDTARRIIAKAALFTIRPDVQAATGCIQLCGGQISGIEAAVHAANEAVLLVDASNAFNSLNRQVALHNISRICPPLSTILINTYRAPTHLFCQWRNYSITGGHHTGRSTHHAHVRSSTDQRTGWALQANVVCRRCRSSGEDYGPPGLVGQAKYPRPTICQTLPRHGSSLKKGYMQLQLPSLPPQE